MNSNFDRWVLVTGGTGFVGITLVKRLLGMGCSVRILTRGVPEDIRAELEEALTSDSRLERFNGKIWDMASIEPAFAGVRYVFHLAALLNSVAPYAEFEKVNVTSTDNICQLCLKYGVEQLFYLSTSDVFGLPLDGRVITEEAPYRSWNEPYADTKIKASQLVKDYQSRGLVSTIIYSGWVYGPHDRAFFPALLQQAKDGFILLWDAGTFEINLVYVEDLVDGILLAMENDMAKNEDFMVFDDASNMHIAEIYHQLGVLFGLKYRTINIPYWLIFIIAWISQGLCRMGLGKKPLLSTTDVKSFGFPFKFSTAKARNKLGWKKNTAADEGIRLWAGWYRQNN